MGDVVKLPPLRGVGNGARNTLQRYFDQDEWPRYASRDCTATPADPGLCPSDHLIAWLWAQGFKVVPT